MDCLTKVRRELTIVILLGSILGIPPAYGSKCSPNEERRVFGLAVSTREIVIENLTKRDTQKETDLFNSYVAQCDLDLGGLGFVDGEVNFQKLLSNRRKEANSLDSAEACLKTRDISYDLEEYEHWAKLSGRTPEQIAAVKSRLVAEKAVALCSRAADLMNAGGSVGACSRSSTSGANAQKIGTLASPDGSPFPISVVSEQYAQELFREVSSQEHIPFKYPQEGCFARAHETAQLLDQKCLITGKAFVTGNLWVATPNSPSGFVRWQYHVASMILVEKGQQNVVYVIDPSLFSKAVPMEEWIAIQAKDSRSRIDSSYVTKRYNYGLPGSRDTKMGYESEDLSNAKFRLNQYLSIQEGRTENALE